MSAAGSEDAITRIEVLMKDIGRHEAEIANLVSEIGEVARDCAENGDEDAKQGLLWYLYWHASGRMKPAHVKRLFKVKDHVQVPPLMVTLPCPKCQKPVEFEATSRDHLRRLQSAGRCGWDRDRWCKECLSAYAAEVKKNSEIARKARAEERREEREWLKECREMPYREYLQTDHWQDTRKRALRRAGYACQLCNKRGRLHVHHRTYENLGDEDRDDLIVLCEHCHAKFHDKLEESR